MKILSKSVFEKESDDDGFSICVMRFIRKNYKYDFLLQDLAPSIKLLNDSRNKKISWNEYEKRYLNEIKEKKEYLKELLELIKTKGTVTLLCAERDDKFCHRKL